MAVRRPKSGPHKKGPAGIEVELVEHLARKSLSINPALRKTGEDDRLAIQRLRSLQKKEAGGGKRDEAQRAPARAATDVRQRRRDAIHFFVEQKEAEFFAELGEIEAEEKRMEGRKTKLRGKVKGELRDFAALLVGDSSPDLETVMSSHATLLTKLGIQARDLR